MPAPKFSRQDLRKILGEAHTDEIENQIMSLHVAVVDGLKDQLTKAQNKADQLDEVQEKLTALEGEDWKNKYEQEHTAFEQYKSDQTAKEQAAKSKTAKTAKYRQLLKDTGVSEKWIDRVLKVTDIDSIKLDKDGNIEGADTLTESIKSEWSDVIETKGSEGAKSGNPPPNGGGKTTSTRAADIVANYNKSLYGEQSTKDG